MIKIFEHMKTVKVFFKGMNWVLAGVLSILGFVSCDRHGPIEYGSPYSDYTVKGSVVNKATGKPIEGIYVGYFGTNAYMYGTPQTTFQPKMRVYTNAKGEFEITNNGIWYQGSATESPVYVEDVDGEKNGSFKSEKFTVDFKNAKQTKKPKGWFEGEYTVTLNVELTESEEEVAE
jgi:putative lipoprotein (rSAM/lipoprotein system)